MWRKCAHLPKLQNLVSPPIVAMPAPSQAGGGFGAGLDVGATDYLDDISGVDSVRNCFRL